MEGLADTRRALAFLASVTDAFAVHEDLQASLDALARAVLPELGDVCLIDVVPPLGDVRSAFAHVDPALERVGRDYRRRFPIERSEPTSPVLRAMKATTPIVALDVGVRFSEAITSDPEAAQLLEALRPSSFYVVPMRLGARCAGAMTFGFARGSTRKPDEVVLALAGEVGRRFGWALDRARRESVAEAERRERVEALRRSREEYRALVECLPDIVARLDRDRRFLYVNSAAEHASGVASDAFLGKTFVESGTPAPIAERWDAIVDRVFATGDPESSTSILDTVFGRREYESRFVAERAADGSVATVIRICRDVTVEHESVRGIQRANRALRALSRCMEEIGRATEEAALVGAICRTIVDVGGYRLAWVGYADDTPGKPVRLGACAGEAIEYVRSIDLSWDAAHPNGNGPTGRAIRDGEPVIVRRVDDDPTFAPWRDAAAAYHLGSTIALPVQRDGKTFATLAIYAAEPDAFDADEVALMVRLADALSLGIDTIRARAAREASAAALRQREEHFRGLIENASDAILDVAADGRIAYASPAIRRILGFEPEQVAGKPVLDLIAPDARARADAVLAAALADPGVVHTFAAPGLHRDGSRRELEFVGHRRAEGEPRLVLHARDVTERARLEEHLRETQKMDAINRLAAGIAHDFNNVLTIVQSAASMLRMRLREGDRAREDANEILQATDRAAALTRQLLLFSRKGADEPRIVDVRAACVEIERMLRRLVGVDVALELELAASPTRVRIDPGQLEQVVLNLAVNARDAMPDGGRITLSVESVELAAQLASVDGPIPKGAYVRLCVSDTGTGIDPAILPRIFDPFFTTKPAGRGTGLGLSTVHSIVHRAGGYVHVESTPGEGARFSVLLPRVDAEPASRPAARARELRGSELVLLVDDDDAVRRLSARALREHGYEVIEAADGREALDVVTRLRPRLRLVVTDLAMPNLRGQALAERLSAIDPDVPVLFVSALADALGPHPLGPRRAFLAKPFTPDALLARVRDLLDAR